MNRQRAVTLIELMVSLVLLALIVAGLANIFVSARRYIVLFRSRAQAMELNKQFIDSLAEHVRYDTWNDPNNPLCTDTSAGCNPTNQTKGTTTLNYIDYDSTFDVEDMDTPEFKNAQLRKVKMTIKWSEPVLLR